VKLKRIPSVFMYAMNIQNDVIGLVLHEHCKSKQMTDFIALPSRCHDTIQYFKTFYAIVHILLICRNGTFAICKRSSNVLL